MENAYRSAYLRILMKLCIILVNTKDVRELLVPPVERYLQDAIDNEPELTWHKQMKDLFSEVIHEAKQTRDFSPERILQIEYTNNRTERGLRKNLFLTAQEVFSNS